MKDSYYQTQAQKQKKPWAQMSHAAIPGIIRFGILLIIMAITTPSIAQWNLLNSGVTNTLRAPYFINPNVGVIVGEPIAPDEAIILKTTDGGLTWVSKPSGTVNALRGVQFIDNNTGFAVGFTGTILKTSNGGDTWTTVASGTTQALRSIHFPSHDIGYICGGAGVILKTTNAGVTWTIQATGITQDLVNVRFINNDIGFAVSSTGTFTSGIIIKTINGGTTWTAVYTNVNGLLGLAVADENTIYAGGGNNQNVGGFSYIVRSTDGGTNWEQVYTGLSNGALRGAAFTSPDKGWFVGDLGEMPYTNDGGITWENVSIQGNGLLGIQFPNSNVGYAVGALGTVLKYSPPPCAPPTNLVYGNVNATHVDLQWDAVPGAAGYKITYHPDGVAAGITKPAPNNSKTLTNLLPNTTYKWAVQTVCSSNPLFASIFVKGADFTTPPQRLSEEQYTSSDLEIFPNPAPVGSSITISLNNVKGSDAIVEVSDALGRLMLHEKATIENGALQYKLPIPVSFSSGMYFVKVIVNQQVYTGHLQYQK